MILGEVLQLDQPAGPSAGAVGAIILEHAVSPSVPTDGVLHCLIFLHGGFCKLLAEHKYTLQLRRRGFDKLRYDLFTEIEKNEGNLIKCSDTEHVKRLIFRIFNGIQSDNPPSELSLSLDIYKLFAELLNPRNMKSKSQNSYEDSIQEVKEYIADHLGESLSVRLLADNVHMSTSHFSRIFKQQTGYSPYDYVLLSRLNRAKDLLQKSNLTIAGIAYETGFNSESNFIYFFTESEGISPGKFRRLKF